MPPQATVDTGRPPCVEKNSSPSAVPTAATPCTVATSAALLPPTPPHCWTSTTTPTAKPRTANQVAETCNTVKTVKYCISTYPWVPSAKPPTVISCTTASPHT